MRTGTMVAFVGGAISALLVSASAYAVAEPTVRAVPAAAVQGSVPFDGTVPVLMLQPPRFVLGSSIDAADPGSGTCVISHTQIPMEANWAASDTGSGLSGIDLLITHSNREPDTGPLPADARSFRFQAGDYHSDCGGGTTDDLYQVTAKDYAGASATSTQISQLVGVWQEDGTNINGASRFPSATVTTTRTGTWSTSTCACFDGGKTAFTTQSGANLTFSVTGALRVALVMPKNTNRGQAGISVDGAGPVIVDLVAAAAQNRVLVWQTELPSTGMHTVTVTNRATAGRPRTDVDSVVVQ